MTKEKMHHSFITLDFETTRHTKIISNLL